METKRELIKLSLLDKLTLKLCKGHLDKKYKVKNNDKLATILEFYKDYFQIDSESEDYYDTLLNMAFTNMMSTYMKIRKDESNRDYDLLQLFNASFKKSTYHNCELPIERTILELYVRIRQNEVTTDGFPRYEFLFIKEAKKFNPSKN